MYSDKIMFIVYIDRDCKIVQKHTNLSNLHWGSVKSKAGNGIECIFIHFLKSHKLS